jgi:hypothetical protein
MTRQAEENITNLGNIILPITIWKINRRNRGLSIPPE